MLLTYTDSTYSSNTNHFAFEFEIKNSSDLINFSFLLLNEKVELVKFNKDLLRLQNEFIKKTQAAKLVPQKKKKKKKKNKYQKMTEKNVTLKQMQQQIRQQ